MFARFLKGFVLTPVLAGSLVLTAGCTSEPGDVSDAPTIPSDPAEQPYDLFLGEQLGIVDYAQRKVRNQCLAEAGYRQNLEVMAAKPHNPFGHLIVTARSFGPTSVEEARRLGFGREFPADPPAIISTDPAYDAASEACDRKAWHRIGKDAARTYREYFALGNKLEGPLQAAQDIELPADLTTKLIACLAEQGYRLDDPGQFLKRPLPELFGVELGDFSQEGAQWQPNKRPGTVEVGPTRGPLRYDPKPEESKLAVAWFTCRQRTDLTRYQLDAAHKVEDEVVKQNETSFVELNPKLEALARTAAELI
ncbi:hypothetical protein JMF97_19745 [Micromonospora fiedleri]|uniref:Uncharacterized protein n=1 Tax=Micromonospora fiedleri TaxID=1157498 RepID=A0ABS1UPX9_9ACTN|nr:hypothetical protein [Micromonospora fiedleri]MBL6278397.1 hypothetical protein [Micromonospora fiedleri]